MAHPNESRLLELYGMLARGDVDGFLAACTDDIVFTVPGNAAVSGTWTKWTFRRMLVPAATVSGGTLRQTITHVIANDDQGMLLLDHRLEREGRPHAYRTAHIVRFRGSLLCAWTEHPGSLAELEEAWGSPGPA
jgi:ketosteroid isomerase-like protein